MIKEEEVYRIGQISKPHGIHGELLMNFTDDSFDQEDCDLIILRRDGILVPFFFNALRYRSDSSCLITLDGIDSEAKARDLAGSDVYLPQSYKLAPEDGEDFTYQDIVGFTAIDKRAGELGEVTFVDESTMNTLMIIERFGKELMVPLHEEFVTEVDLDTRTIHLVLPSGLLNLDSASFDTDEDE